jgi:hypothetical protein
MVALQPIWIVFRGINYTDQATRQVGRNIDQLVQKQQELRQQAVRLAMAGMMWTVFAGLAVMAISKIMEKSMEGRRILHEFDKSMNKMLSTIADGFAKVMGPSMKLLGMFFDIIAKHPMIGQLVAVLATLLISFMALKGITMILSGLSTYLGVSHLFQAQATKQLTLTQFGCTASTMTLSGAFKILRASLGPAFMIFMLFFQVGVMFQQHAPIILGVIIALTAVFAILAATLWSAATAMSILTFGAAAAIGVGAAIAASASAPTYETGVRSVRKTGLVMAHEGEEIRSKRNVAYGQGQETKRPETRQFNITFTGDIHTKADKEELKPLILKTVRDAMDNKA